MPFKIQRVPRGLLELLSISGGGNPTELEDRVRASLELMQFYGLQQRQTLLANNAAAAENTLVSVTPSATNWTLLFAAASTVTVTATMTALHHHVVTQRGGSTEIQIPLATREIVIVGATVTGACHCPWTPPYPWLLPPGAIVSALATIIGTDATASVSVRAEFGVLS